MKHLCLRDFWTKSLKITLGMLLVATTAFSQFTDQPPTCLHTTCGPELVTNGDFENGNTGFSSDYTLTNTPCCCATYAIRGNAYAFHPGHWFTRWDHTFGDDGDDNVGLFFIGDAHCTPDIRRAWFQNITIQAGTTYAYKAWVTNLDDNIYPNKAVFNLRSNGVVLFTQSYLIADMGTSANDRWIEICGEYTSTVSGPVEISIDLTPSVTNPNLLGADFGIDDISFRAISPGSPTFTYFRKTDCTNDFVTFTANTVPGIHTWNFGSPDAIPTTSTGPTAQTIYTQPGTFTVTHTLSLPNSPCVETEEIQITVVECEITPCLSELEECGANLVVNGDFESGATAFSSGLGNIANDMSGTFGSCAGRYTVDNNSLTHSGDDNNGSTWLTPNDHTSGTGKFFIGDPPCTSDGVVVWSQLINVNPGSTYNFSAWLSNLSPTDNEPVILLRADGQPVTIPTPIQYNITITDKWTKLCGSFTPTTNPILLEIEVGASADVAIAADFGLDDIEFINVGAVTAEFTATIGACAGSDVNFTSVQTGVNHTWDFGDNSGTSTAANPVYNYNLAGTYTVTHTVIDPVTGCEDVVTHEITIENCCRVTSAFTFTPSQDLSTCEVSFTDQSTFSVETGQIDSWLWTFVDNDGTITTSTAQDPVHTFNGPGPHNVCLEVTGTAGGETCKDVVCQEVNSPCQICHIDAAFTWNEVIRVSGLVGSVELHFTDQSTFIGAQTQNNAQYAWSFVNPTGNNGTGGPTEIGQSQPQNREFATINDEGQAIVTLTITSSNNGQNCSDTYCQTIDLKTLIGTPCSNRMSGEENNDFGSIELNGTSISAFPNPFSTAINLLAGMSDDGKLMMDVIDMNGKAVTTLVNDQLDRGLHTFQWMPDASLNAGLYMLRVENANGVTFHKLILNR